ncbi:MAG: alpha/beta hydrolase [Caldilineaceae bacterium]
MEKRLFYSILMVILLSLTACSAGTGANSNLPQPSNSVATAECQLSAKGSPLRIAAQCGTYTVYENRAKQAGRQIELNFAIIKALSRSPKPDAVFFLAGGPGQAATEAYLAVSPAFDKVHRDRDIVLVDQRGTGKLSRLGCKPLDDLNADDEAVSKWLTNCAEGLDADPTQYTTEIAMGDLDEIRTALGYQTINLVGVSYGTRAAQTYLKLYPDHVRSVTLDGVVPQSEVLGADVATDAERALDLIFQRCAESDPCKQQYPNLATEFTQLMDQLQKSSQSVDLADPVTGEPTTVVLDYRTAAMTVRLYSYAPETAALLPLLIHEAAVNQNYLPFAAQSILVGKGLSDSINSGMNLSVVCAEDFPFFDKVDLQGLTENSYYGSIEIDSLRRFCAIWPHSTVDPSFKDPVQSDRPVLLLSGQADPVTPPSNAEQVAQKLSNSLQIVAPGQGHNVIMRGCIPRIFADFIEKGTAQGLDTTCVNDLKPMPFFINPSGPTP